MTRSALNMAAAEAILRALGDRAGFARFGDGPVPMMLAKRAKGGTIDDPECDGLYETLSSGIFRRFVAESGGTRSFRWLYLCPASPEHLAAALGHDLDAMDETALRSIPSDAAFQVYKRRGLMAVAAA